MILQGDALEVLRTFEPESVHCCITSPPYFGLRDYSVNGQIGVEDTPAAYVARLVEVFCGVHRVLRDDGTLWLNLGDSYAGSGKGRWNAHDERKTATRERVKNTYKTGMKASPIGDGLKAKDLIGIPWRVALALQADGWHLRNDIIWHKPNPMPSSVQDRFTSSHEHVFLLSKSPRYFFDQSSVMEEASERARGGKNAFRGQSHPGRTDSSTQANREGRDMKGIGFKQDNVGNSTYTGFNGRYEHKSLRNKRDVWTIAPKPFKGAHFATFPPALIEPMVKAGCPADGVILDPFFGAGTTGVVAGKLGRRFVGIELNPEYIALAEGRLNDELGVDAW